ncbi:MAG: hypothetical protein GWN32_01250 [Gemmatimonadetes bacterium]|nr:hypothetical protein [Gemmatimonadota bacterium]
MAAVFLAFFFLPAGALPEFDGPRNAPFEALQLTHLYAREHVITCLIPAFFIAGAMGIFVRQAAVMKYLGAGANKAVAYGVAATSGTILAVCSCTVLPLFAGIYGMGAGLGPATAFLYSGPAINVLAIIFTARVLGVELGLARVAGAVVFAVIIGLLMHGLFRRDESERLEASVATAGAEEERPLWQTATFFAALVGILVFANWGEPGEARGVWSIVYEAKWWVTAGLGVALGAILVAWFELQPRWVVAVALLTVGAALLSSGPLVPFTAGTIGLSIVMVRSGGPAEEWFASSWGFAKQILPLLFAGVLIAGALLGRPGHAALIPPEWISDAVGGNSAFANGFASVAGAFMYFATLTEVPILDGLLGSGMGSGPALALLLAGPALSLPNMLVIRSVLRTKKTLAYVSLVVVMSAAAGLIYGAYLT